ncbi:hypothetical protein VP01_3182g3, partial [Puccinia sorghi]
SEVIVRLFKALAKDLPPTSLPSTKTEFGENSQRLANIWNVLRMPWGRLCRMIISDLDSDEDGNENNEYLIGDSSKSLEEPTDQLINEDADINLANLFILIKTMRQNHRQQAQPKLTRLHVVKFQQLLHPPSSAEINYTIQLETRSNLLCVPASQERHFRASQSMVLFYPENTKTRWLARGIVHDPCSLKDMAVLVFLQRESSGIWETCKVSLNRCLSTLSAVGSNESFGTSLCSSATPFDPRRFHSLLISIIHHTADHHFEPVLNSLATTATERAASFKPDCASSATKNSTAALETSLNCSATVAGTTKFPICSTCWVPYWIYLRIQRMKTRAR